MTISKKLRVGVIYGGRSGEHEVSLRSAASIMQHLDRTLFEVIPVGIDKQGNWLLDNIENVYKDKERTLSLNPTTADVLPMLRFNETTSTSLEKSNTNKGLNSSKQDVKPFDVAFPIIHGSYGEDGCLQGLLELLDVPYVGSNVLASAIGMDKDIAKRLVRAAGINVPHYCVFTLADWQSNPTNVINKIKQEFTYPVFTKPAQAGSSVGINKIKSDSEINAAIEDALKYDHKILVEQGLPVLDIELAVLENLTSCELPLVSPVGEIRTNKNHEFYSYDAKYLDPNGAELIIPANLTEPQLKQAQAISQTIFKTLECEGMARVDLFWDTQQQCFLFNEINTIPGFTTISMFPKLWQAGGMSYPDLLTYMVKLAIVRHERKLSIKRTYAKDI